MDRPEEVEQMAKEMLGNRLITNQTGPEGQLVSKVCVCLFVLLIFCHDA